MAVLSLADPFEYCQRVAQNSASSFYASFRFLPAARRRAITVLYAFCREVDDVVDEHGDVHQAQQALAQWREQIRLAFTGGAPQHPVARAVAQVAREFALPQLHFEEIIDGMQMDLTQARYADYDALRQYCYHAASAVGLLSARIFGAVDEAVLRYASELGQCLQLINIIRDVGEDFGRGRIYLPADEMRRFGVAEADLGAAQSSPALVALLRFQAQRARQLYADALAALPARARAAQAPGLVMAALYLALLDKIERRDFAVLSQRVRLHSLHKFGLALLAWRRARR